VIEVAKGSRNRFKYAPTLGCFLLCDVLPVGSSFPYDFGFVPGTRAEDGDPIDVLLLGEEPLFPGAVVPSRLLGVIEAEQTEEGETIRNDRLVGVATGAHEHEGVHSLRDLSPRLLSELEQFFQSYSRSKGRAFRCVGQRGPRTALQLVEQALLPRQGH
jgi:inorganic pyrophosphatase